MIVTMESTTQSSAPVNPMERRHNKRYTFRAEAKVVEMESGMTLPGRTADLSCGGCYVDTINPYPAGTMVNVKLENWDRSFEAQAKVVYAAMGLGMGLMFVAVDPKHRSTMEWWMAELGQRQSCEFAAA
jgi:PilZ domain